jgi:ribosomal protein S18 acetylase RimI-like enzyme
VAEERRDDVPENVGRDAGFEKRRVGEHGPQLSLISLDGLGEGMNTLDVVAGVQYGVLEHSEVRAMARLLAEVFSRYDPPAVAVGLSSPQVEVLVMALGSKAVAEQLSIVASTPPNEDLVGALLVEDFGTPPPDGLEDVAPDFAPIGAMLDGLDSQYRTSRHILPGAYLHLFMVGVAAHASGRGIAQHLITTSLTNGKARGYRLAVTEATGSVSQHVFRKLGFRDVLAAPYKDYVFNGQRVFSSIVGPEATILMEREL